LETVKYLVEKGICANVQDGKALINAARNDQLETVKYLVEGAPEDQRVRADVQDGKALINAALNGHLETVIYLVEDQGVRADVQDGWALIKAAGIGQLETVKYLVEKGADIELAITTAQSYGYDRAIQVLREVREEFLAANRG